MRESERNVGRADHNPEGAQAATQGDEDPSMITPDDSADARAHGTHGRGGGEERRDDRPAPEPDASADSDRGGSGGWGSEASGGSTFDKRKRQD